MVASCLNPDSKLVDEDEFTLSLETKPRCLSCGAMEFELATSQVYRCTNCGMQYNEEEYTKMCLRTYPACLSCNTKLLAHSNYPFVLVCNTCGKVLHPDEENIDEYSNIEFRYYPKRLHSGVLPGEETKIRKVYKCPLYSLTLSIDSIFCRKMCGFREEE